MAIGDKGYGENGSVGFDDVTKREANPDGSPNPTGKPEEYRDSDKFEDGEHYGEVVSLFVWETKDGKDFHKIWLRAKDGKMIRQYGEVTTRSMWKMEKALKAIFGKTLPVEQVQGGGGKMPLKTQTEGLGVWVKFVVSTDPAYDNQNVLIVDGRYGPPEGAVPMYDIKTHEATGKVPTSALGSGTPDDEPDADGDDW